MSEISTTIQNADWKIEKHAPVLQAPETVKAGEVFTIQAGIGDAIAHPNTPQHHIAWLAVFFQPEGSKFPIELGRADFSAHGFALNEEPGVAWTEPVLSVTAKVMKSGTLQAVAYCNIHGLWQSAKHLAVS